MTDPQQPLVALYVNVETMQAIPLGTIVNLENHVLYFSDKEYHRVVNDAIQKIKELNKRMRRRVAMYGLVIQIVGRFLLTKQIEMIMRVCVR